MDADSRRRIHDAIVSLSAGDRRGVPDLVKELWPVLLAFAQRGVGNAMDAEDIAQEVFVRICARISEFDTTRGGVSWAFGIASYEILTHRKRAQRRREAAGVDVSAHRDDAPTQEDVAAQREVIAGLRELVGELSDEDRRALGLDQEESASATPAERKRKQRALAKLRMLWRRIHG